MEEDSDASMEIYRRPVRSPMIERYVNRHVVLELSPTLVFFTVNFG